MLLLWKFDRTTLSRGSKSRNKVSVGEPAEGSLPSLEKKYYYDGYTLRVDVFEYGVSFFTGAKRE